MKARWGTLSAMVLSTLCHAQVCPTPAVPDGTYFIVSASTPHFCVDAPIGPTDTNNDPLKIQKMFCNGNFTERFVLGRRDSNCFSIQAAGTPRITPFLFMFILDDNVTVRVGQDRAPSPFPSAPSVWRWYLEKVPQKEGHYYICTSDEHAPHINDGKRCWAGTGFPGDAGTYIEAQKFSATENQEWTLSCFSGCRQQVPGTNAKKRKTQDKP